MRPFDPADCNPINPCLLNVKGTDVVPTFTCTHHKAPCAICKGICKSSSGMCLDCARKLPPHRRPQGFKSCTDCKGLHGAVSMNWPSCEVCMAKHIKEVDDYAPPVPRTPIHQQPLFRTLVVLLVCALAALLLCLDHWVAVIPLIGFLVVFVDMPGAPLSVSVTTDETLRLRVAELEEQLMIRVEAGGYRGPMPPQDDTPTKKTKTQGGPPR